MTQAFFNYTFQRLIEIEATLRTPVQLYIFTKRIKSALQRLEQW